MGGGGLKIISVERKRDVGKTRKRNFVVGQ
jgi:hypothetical protein